MDKIINHNNFAPLSLTFDDVQIVPQYSEIPTRSQIDVTTKFTINHSIAVPLIAAPMDTVCGADMAYSMLRLGGVGVIHRFCSIDEQVAMAKHLTTIISREMPVRCAAIGVNGDSIERAQRLVDEAHVNVLLIDVAHGHHKNVADMIELLNKFKSNTKNKFDIIAGNVATAAGAKFLESAGADAIRVGVGGGSACETRIRTGIGVPQLQAIMDVVNSGVDIPIISDGGIRYPGDVAKALAAGADSVMIGGLFAGTNEAPGEIFIAGQWPYNKTMKMYRGSASATAKLAVNGKAEHVEGASKLVETKGSIEHVVKDILDGVRSSMSYVGSNNLAQFRLNSLFVRITTAGLTEAHPHMLK